MKNKGFKKYTISLFVCFFAFLGFVKADEIRTLNLGTAYRIGDGTFDNLVCSADSPYVSVNNKGGESEILYDTRTEDLSGIVNVHCTWQGKRQVGTPTGPGSEDSKFRLSNEAYGGGNGSNVTELTIQMSSADGISTPVNVSEMIGGGNITSYEFTEGEEYVEFEGGTCAGSRCVLALSTLSKQMGGANKLKAELTLNVDKNGTSYTAKVHISINAVNATKLFPGNYGTCELSGWSPATYQNSTFYTTDRSGATLPNCNTNNTQGIVEFKGWIKVRMDQATIMSSNRCPDDQIIPAGSTAETNGTYMACYKSKDSVIITFARGSLAESGDWKSVGNSSNTYFYNGSGGSATLPDLSGVEGFKGWVKNGAGDPIAAGNYVPLDGSRYSALLENEVSYVDTNKVVREGGTTALKVPNVKNCTSDNPAIKAEFVGGECQVSAGKDTSGISANVVVELENGETVTYTFSAIPQLNKENPDFFVDTSINLEWGVNYNGQDGSTASDSDLITNGSSCPTLNIKWGGQNTTQDNLFGNPYGGANEQVRSTSYEAQSACDGTKYWAFCLDPGLHGPDDGYWHPYLIQDNDLQGHKRLFKLVSYLVKQYPDLTSIVVTNWDTDKIAIHHATRIAAMIDGVDSGPGAFSTRYYYYRHTATAVAACGEDGDVSSCIRTAITNNFVKDGDTSGNRASMINMMTDFLTNSLTENPASGSVEKTIESQEVTTEGTNIVNTVKGTFTLPANVSDVKLEPCGANSFGITCQPASISQKGTTEDGSSIYEYTVVLTRAVGAGALPKTTAEKKTVSYKLSYTGSGVEMMNLAVSAEYPSSWQRMLVFNLGDANIYAYFPFQLDCEAYISGLDSYLSNPSSYPYADEFKSAGCCAYLTDETKYGDFLKENCGERCTTNTLNQVCSYSPTSGKVDVYRIKEGHKNGNPQIGSCVVKVDEKYSVGANSSFIRNDDVGNKYNIKEYDASANEYCEVTCREDWTIVMEAFGNYVGKNAVAAGTYFKSQTDDMFIGTKRECYTSYIDYQGFVKEMSNLSQEVVNAYNSYSYAAHAYADYKKQTESDNKLEFSSETGCLKMPTCADENGEGYDYIEGQCLKPATCPPEEEEGGEGGSPTPEGDDVTYGDVEINGSCYISGSLPTCPEENYGQINNFKLDTRGDITSGDKDKKYSTKTENDNTNKKNVVTEKRLLGDSSPDMKNIYKGTSSISCTTTWATEPGETATGLSCTKSIQADDASGTTTSTNSDHCKSEASVEGVSGYCKVENDYKKNETFKEMQQYNLEVLESDATKHRSEMTSKTRTIYEKDEKFYSCQHIQLHNDSSLPSNATNNEIMKIDKYVLGKTIDYTKVSSKFEPGATYNYDDQAYMTILGKDNLIEQYKEKNDKALGSDFASSTNIKKEYELSNVNQAGGGTGTDKINLAKNYLETTYYSTDKIWTKTNVGEDVINKYDNGEGELFEKGDTKDYATKEGRIVLCQISAGTTPDYNDKEFDLDKELVAAGTDDPDWKSGSCFQVYLRYNDVNYVKTSIENSSFYKNKGDWYFSNSSGLFVAHGDNKEDAISKLKKLNGTKMDAVPNDSKYWDKVGIFNVFPISLSTPRNIYTYTYNFGDMGYYAENGNLGRIMGGKKSVIQENSRTCFYEVFEEACICCGSQTYDYSYSETVKDAATTMAGEMGYGMSDTEEIKKNKKGTLSISASPVQLSDLSSDKNRELASNWGTSSFYYDGVLYKTDKGSELLKEIEAKGETIYDKTDEKYSQLEYEYVLTPNDIASIKEYNDRYGYGISYDRLKIIDRYNNGDANGADISNKIDINDAETISFMHYGSTFLEDFLPAEVTKKALYQGGNVKVCEVESGSVLSAASTDPLLRKKMKEGCRWVDYVTPATFAVELKHDTYNTGVLNQPTKLRMAFK
ncbi:MAG TPA: hypothetical protein DCE23_06020 [Firmicutes bacterium]|nr:hypothetical protein [Bacillota bacterium]